MWVAGWESSSVHRSKVKASILVRSRVPAGTGYSVGT